MSSIDAEAREVLLRRRRSLSDHDDPPAGDGLGQYLPELPESLC